MDERRSATHLCFLFRFEVSQNFVLFGMSVLIFYLSDRELGRKLI